MTSTRPEAEKTAPEPARERGPARFQQPEPEAGRPGLAGSIGSAVLLMLLVVGVPVLLVWLSGVPSVPTSLPTRAELTATIGVEQLLTVLVLVVWLAWLQFTVCVVVELRSALSGVGLPARVPLAGPSQRMARTLVASVLLLLTAVGPATALGMPASGPPQAGGVSISSTVDAHVLQSDLGQGPAAAAVQGDVAAPGQPAIAQGEVTYHLGDRPLTAEEGISLAGQKVYVVQPPEGRYHDNLWDIAERELGDGRRYHEIYELNKGRAQPDGQELSLARLIQPSWLLVMPEDAAGVQRVEAVAAPVPVSTVPSAPVVGGSATADLLGPDAASQESAAADVVGPTSGEAGHPLLGAGLLAAGLLAAIEVQRRRRRTPEPSGAAVEVEVALRIGAQPERAVLLDRGLRQLAAASQRAGRDLPGVYAAVVDASRLVLRLAPAELDAPAPWQVAKEGREWSIDRADVDLRSRAGFAPFPGLVSVGRDEAGADVLIDLEAAQGPVAIIGPEGVAREVATALAAELATNSWSDGLRVTGVGLPDGLDALDPVRYRAVGSVAEALSGLRARRADAQGAGVLTGRVHGTDASAWIPEYVVVGAPVDGQQAAALVSVASTDQRAPWGVVCVGELPGSRWQVVVDAGGSLRIRLLDVVVQANRLSAGDAAAVAELVTAATAAGAEAQVLDGSGGGAERPSVVPPSRHLDPTDLSTAPVRVHVLGAPRVHAPRPIDSAREALATELVVHLALHPDGVHETVLAGVLWPRGVTADVREATIDRVAQWLGTDDDGASHLLRRPDGRLQLGPGVVVDWDVVRSLLARSRSASTRAQERSDLAAALRLAQGGVLSERPSGRYAWLVRIRLERASRDLLVDAAHQLVLLCRDGGDPTAAQEAAWAGLQVAPTEEVLWRDLLRAAAAVGGTRAVQDIAADLEATLHGAGIADMSAPTAALLDELMPSSSAPGSGRALGLA